MAEAKLSLDGLYEWDNDLFELMVIPEGLEGDVLIPNLLVETAELEILYPNPVVMKTLIGIWSSKQLPTWNALYATTQYDYNPIENYNRYEEETITTDDDRTEGVMHSGSDSSTGSGSNTITDKIAAFNIGSNLTDQEGLAPQSKSAGSNSATGSTTYGHRINTMTGIDREESKESHVHGNIGVMSTQQMIEQERNVAKFNMYDIIIREFIERFCVMVY